MKFKYKKIKDIAVVYSGTTPSTSKSEYWNGNIKWITPAELQDGHNWYIYDTERKITDEAVRSKNLKMLKKGTILLTTRAPIGKVALVGEVMCTNQGFKNIECNTDVVNPEFLYFWLLSKKEYLNSLGRGATFKEISKTIVENIQVPVPPLGIQGKIVEILKQSLFLIDKRKAQIEALDQLTQSVFLEMFGDPVTNPNGWEIVNLQDIADYFIGLTYKPNDVSDEGIVVLRSSNIQNGVIDLNDIVRVKKEVNDKLLVKQNDILMCSRNGSARLVGKVALIPELEERMTFGAFMTIIRSRYYCYLYNYFQSSAFRRQITSGATTTINQITKKMLNYVKLPLPPTSLQNEFAHKVEQIQHQKEILQTSLLELENMYNSLMQKAFKGELFTEEKVSNL